MIFIIDYVNIYLVVKNICLSNSFVFTIENKSTLFLNSNKKSDLLYQYSLHLSY